jgi:hypothetical protein
MLFVHFDYGYHVGVTAFIGLCNTAGWLAWAWWQRKYRSHVWLVSMVGVGMLATVGFELLDFPPLRYDPRVSQACGTKRMSMSHLSVERWN